MVRVEEEGHGADPGKIIGFEEEIDSISARILLTENELVNIYDTYPEAVRNMEKLLLDNYQDAMENTKKTSGLDMMRTYVASKSEKTKEEMLAFSVLEAKRKVLSDILDAQKTRMSGIQSKMRYSSWTGG